jgi:hypothetical protein
VRRFLSSSRTAGFLLAAGVCGAAGAPPASAQDPAPAAAVALDDHFHGELIGLDGTKVKLRYDFASADQRKDWVDWLPWAIEKDAGDGVALGDGRLSMRGSAGARHVGEWEGDLSVTCRMIPDGVKDIGSYLGSDEMSSDYASFTIAETFFHGWDKKPGGETGMMKFGKQFALSKTGGFTGFRYLAFRRPTVEPSPGKPVAYGFGRIGEKYFLRVDDLDLDSKEPPPRLRGLVAGFYAVKSSMAVDDVVIEGVLSPRWLAAKNVALRASRPIATQGAGNAGPAVDPAVQALLLAYREGKESALKLVDVVRDTSRPESDRAAVAEALKKGPRKALDALVDVLYSPDVKVRAMGIDIVKALTGGKSYGYDPKAGEKARGAAVSKLRKDLNDNPKMTEGSGG